MHPRKTGTPFQCRHLTLHYVSLLCIFYEYPVYEEVGHLRGKVGHLLREVGRIPLYPNILILYIFNLLYINLLTAGVAYIRVFIFY